MGRRGGSTGFWAGAAAAAALALCMAAGAGPAQAKNHGVTAKVKDGTLTVSGNNGSNIIALGLQAGAPDVLQIDVEDDGSADFDFKRDKFDHIVVNAGGGADAVRIDGLQRH